MFSGGNQSTKETSKNGGLSSSVNIIGEGTSIQGDINSNGDIRVDGKITGTIVSKAKVAVGPTGEVIGDIVCKNADISGKIKGKINISELLFLKSTSVLEGSVKTEKLVIESGAKFNGDCKMGKVANMSDVKDASHDSTVKKEAV